MKKKFFWGGRRGGREEGFERLSGKCSLSFIAGLLLKLLPRVDFFFIPPSTEE